MDTENTATANVCCVLHAPSTKEPFVVLDKPAGLPTAPLREDDNCALSQAIALFPELAAVCGKKPIERGLLHRLDTATRGCVLIAATQDAYEQLQIAQKSGQFTKWYAALVDKITPTQAIDSFPPAPSRQNTAFESPIHASTSAATSAQNALTVADLYNAGLQQPQTAFCIQSQFRPYGQHNAAVRPVTPAAGKAAQKKASPALYRTNVLTVQTPSPEAHIALCSITAGYRHQVRCHLAWCGIPVHGDALYNPTYHAAESLCFAATHIRFPNPTTGSFITIGIPEKTPLFK